MGLLREILHEVKQLREEQRSFFLMSQAQDAELTAAVLKLATDTVTLVQTQQTTTQQLLDAISASGATSDPAVAKAVADVNATDQKVNDTIAALQASVSGLSGVAPASGADASGSVATGEATG